MNNIISKKIILGTAQLGFNYGVCNQTGLLDIQEAVQLLNEAYDSGISALDTAQGYGRSHQIIGEFHKQYRKYFKICTKFVFSEDNSPDIESTLHSACLELNVKNLDTVLIHSADSISSSEKNIEALLILKKKGILNKIGMSLYDCKQIDLALDNESIDIVQMPFNLLDNMNLRLSQLEKAKKNKKEIVARSVYLQGVLCQQPDKLPEKLWKLRVVHNRLWEIAKSLNVSLAYLALNYVLWNPYINSLIIGVDNQAQLKDNLSLAGNALPEEAVKEIHSLELDYSDSIDPRVW